MSAIDTDPAHAGNHGDEDELDHDTLHITVGGYVTGFVLSVILTAIPFWLVMAKVFSNPTVTTFIILGFAIVQIYVHMVFFLHMTSKAEGGWAWMSLIFTLVLVTQFRRRRAIEPGPFPFWVVVVYGISVVAVLRLWLNVVGWPQPSGVGAYAVVLTWALGLFGFIFVRTIELFLHRAPQA